MRVPALLFTLLLTSACAMDDPSTPRPGSDPERLTENTWVFESVAGEPIPDRARVTLQFDSDEKRAFGLAACNRYTAAYSLDGQAFSLQMMASTKMACPEPLMNTEDRFLGALRQVTGYAIDADGRLRLSGPDGTLATGTAEPQNQTE